MNFDALLKPMDRGLLKWSPTKNNADVICMSVADLDFPTPSCVIDTLQREINGYTFGYRQYDDSAKKAIVNWLATQYQWSIKQEQIFLVNKISQGVKYAIEAFTSPHSSILIMEPFYGPFQQWIKSMHRTVITNPLVIDKGFYSIDFYALEQQIIINKVAALLLCNPHNPTGRVWTIDELQTIGQICRRHGVIIISDDAHCDIVRQNVQYAPIAKVCPDNDVVTIYSPAKAYGTASLMTAYIVCSHMSLIEQLTNCPTITPNTNCMSAAAIVGAYSDPDYLMNLNKYIDENMSCFNQWWQHMFPYNSWMAPQSTYLIWLDISFTRRTSAEIYELCKNNGLIILSGMAYGDFGKKFIRINVGTSREILKEGLKRLEYILLSQTQSI